MHRRVYTVRPETTMVPELRLTLSALCLAGLLAGAGCQAGPVTAPGAISSRTQPATLSKNVTILELDGTVVVGAAIVEGGGDTPLARVIVPIHSMADHDLDIEYRFELFNSEHRLVDGMGRWRSLHVGPQVQVQIEAFAPQTGVADWALTIRPGPQDESSIERGN